MIRNFLLALAAGTSLILQAQQRLKINRDRLWGTLQQLATYGRDADGQPNRVAYSDGDIAGRAYVTELMRQAGLTVRTDAAGNLV